MKRGLMLLFAVGLINAGQLFAQDTTTYKLRLSAPVIDLPQNTQLPYTYPSMYQALEVGNDFYELGFWGIEELGNRIIKKENGASKGKKFANGALKYALGLAFSNYGSELPIPLGVWAHEEYHRSVLGVAGVASKNGNWLLSRWDGTVYGPTDGQLDNLKASNLTALLYSYTAGVQAENTFTRKNVITDFYYKRSQYKNALYLYNAYYVWNYFNFSTSAISDSVKVLAPPHENADPSQRDFAGADLTAWAYDMFNPGKPFTSRDSFPNGSGVNRRVGFSDLSSDAQDFLKKQKTLSLINFINPAIFFVNRIKVNDYFSFNFFAQYAPTHFGNSAALYVPFKIKQGNYLVAAHNYTNKNKTWWGIEAGIYDYKPLANKKIQFSTLLSVWQQPKNQSYYDEESAVGGSLQVDASYKVSKNFSAFASVIGKTKGWVAGSPYLNDNLSLRAGINYSLKK
jgi:hypothetical protein